MPSILNFLNPFSKSSGIYYVVERPVQALNGKPFNGLLHKEMQDELFHEKILRNWRRPLTLWQGIKQTFHIIVGGHYDFRLKGQGNKGVLGLFLFPQVSRIIIANFRNSVIAKILSIFVAAPLELLRFTLGVGLTLIASPFVFIGHLIKKSKTDQLKKEVLNLDVCSYDRVGGKWSTLNKSTLGNLLNKNKISVDDLVNFKREQVNILDQNKKTLYKRTLFQIYPDCPSKSHFLHNCNASGLMFFADTEKGGQQTNRQQTKALQAINQFGSLVMYPGQDGSLSNDSQTFSISISPPAPRAY